MSEKKHELDDLETFAERKRCVLDTAFPRRLTPSSYGQPKKFKAMQEEFDYPILCHRPASASSTPVTLLHPIFGEFVDDCTAGRPTPEDVQFVLKLSSQMSEFYSSEGERAKDFRELITDYCGLTFTASKWNNERYITDFSLVIGKLCAMNKDLIRVKDPQLLDG
jgi:hypothetical protein